jgi:hypothetical protein
MLFEQPEPRRKVKNPYQQFTKAGEFTSMAG